MSVVKLLVVRVLALESAGAVAGALVIGALNTLCATPNKIGDVTLLYAGAEDCAPYRSWQNNR